MDINLSITLSFIMIQIIGNSVIIDTMENGMSITLSTSMIQIIGNCIIIDTMDINETKRRLG